MPIQQLLPVLNYMDSSGDFDDDNVFGSIPTDPVDEVIQHKVRGRPPAFESLMYPIRMVCDRSSYINGFRFEFAMPLTEKFQMVHTWNLLNKGPQNKNPNKPAPKSAYNYALTYGYPNMMNFDYILMARGQGDGRFDAFVLKNLTPELTMKVSTSFMNNNVQQGVLGADFDYQTKKSNVGVKLTSGYVNFSWMERIHRHLILGFDYTKIMSQSMTIYGYGAKLLFGAQNFYAQYLASQALFMLGHELKLKNKTTLVSSFTYQKMKQKTTAIVGIKKEFESNEIVATLNSRGKVATSVSIMMGKEVPLKVRLCSIVDYYKDSYKFGYGLSIGT